MYQICENCRFQRESGALDLARHCSRCKGTGIVRSRSSYICNKCGGSMCPEDNTPNRDIPHGLVEEQVTGGYDSFHLFDLSAYTFSLCEQCLRQLFDSCTIYPNVYCQSGDRVSYEEDQTQYMDRMWRKSGGHITKMFTDMCNTTMECTDKAIWRISYDSQNPISPDICCDEHKSKYDNYSTVFFAPYEHWNQEQYESLKLISGVMNQ